MNQGSTAPGGSESLEYDGFISYSHAADDLLAPRLQSALQRFAKPWWKRRAVRIFRDESSLSANPHLWSSITEALDQSGWFVLLLSPDAAASQWVNQEVEFWLEHKDPDRIIPVLTDGDFTWSDHDFVSDAAPPALQGAFSDEPRWVDLRFARSEEQLDLQNPQFLAAIADVASAIRGVPKDELESEEVHQHRRTVRTAWAAGVALLVLVVLASAGAIVAIGQSNEAQAQRDNAARQAVIALENEATAIAEADRATTAEQAEARQRAVAESEAANALEQEAVARSRELAAASVSVLDENPELATMLALESIKATAGISSSSPAGVMSLRQSVQDNPLLKRFPVTEGENSAQISGDGSMIYYSTAKGRSVSAIDTDTGETLWVYHDPTTNDLFGNVGLSPDETLVTLEIVDVSVVEDDSVVVDEQENDEHPARVVVLSASDGSVERILVPGTCPFLNVWNSGFSPDGRYFAIFTGTEGCLVDPSADWVAVYDTTTWVEVERLQIGEMTGEQAVFSGDSTTVLVVGESDSAEAQLQSFPEGETLQTYGTMSGVTFAGALSPDGERVVVWGVSDGGGVDLRPVLLDAATGERISFLDAVDDFVSNDRSTPRSSRSAPISFSSDGSKIAVTTRSGDFVFDGDNGRLLTTLGESGFTYSHSFTADSSRLVTTISSGVLVLDLEGGSTNAGVPLEPPGEDPVWINPDGAREGPHVAVSSLVDEPRGPSGVNDHISVIDPSSGAVTAGIRGAGIQLPDGRFVVVRSTATEEDTGILSGPTVLWEPGSGQITELAGCVIPQTDLDGVNDLTCPDGGRFFGSQTTSALMPFAAAPDGSFFAAVSYATRDGEMAVRVWDSASLTVRSEFVVPGTRILVGAGVDWLAFIDHVGEDLFFYDVDSGSLARTLKPSEGFYHSLDQSQDGSVLFLASFGSTISAFDTSDWELLGRWEAHEAFIRGLAVSPDGTRLATTSEDNFVKVWDVSGLGDLTEGQFPPLLDRIPAPKPSDAVWLDDDLLGLLLAQDARWMVVSLDVDDLVSEARDKLTRGFTPLECATYQIDNCPTTLEAIRAS